MVLIKKFKRKLSKSTAKDFSMSINDSEERVPLIPIQPAKQIYKEKKWNGPVKSLLLVFLLAAYGYIYFYIGGMILNYEELSRVAEITENMKKRINRLFEIEIEINNSL